MCIRKKPFTECKCAVCLTLPWNRLLIPLMYLFLFFLAGDTIAQLTDVGSVAQSPPDGRVTVFSDRTGMVKAARLLLSSVTKVLVLADRIVIKQIITSRNKVSLSHGLDSASVACTRRRLVSS